MTEPYQNRLKNSWRNSELTYVLMGIKPTVIPEASIYSGMNIEFNRWAWR